MMWVLQYHDCIFDTFHIIRTLVCEHHWYDRLVSCAWVLTIEYVQLACDGETDHQLRNWFVNELSPFLCLCAWFFFCCCCCCTLRFQVHWATHPHHQLRVSSIKVKQSFCIIEQVDPFHADIHLPDMRLYSRSELLCCQTPGDGSWCIMAEFRFKLLVGSYYIHPMWSVVVLVSLCRHRMSKHFVGWLKYLHTNHLVKRTFIKCTMLLLIQISSNVSLSEATSKGRN